MYIVHVNFNLIASMSVENQSLTYYLSFFLLERFYALAAAAALLKYVEFIQNVIFAAHSLKVEYQGAHHGTIIGNQYIPQYHCVPSSLFLLIK